MAKDNGDVPERVQYCRPCLGPCTQSKDSGVKSRLSCVEKFEANIKRHVGNTAKTAPEVKKALRRFTLLMSWEVHATPMLPQLYLAFVVAPINSGTGAIFTNTYATLLAKPLSRMFPAEGAVKWEESARSARFLIGRQKACSSEL